MKYENMLIGDVLKIRGKYTNHIGIEIETEGKNLPHIDTPVWKSERDPSLRGESFEYVLRKPVRFDEVNRVLNEMQKHWHDAGSEIKDSPNAGVHVHINVSDLTVAQMYNFVSLYLVVENILIAQCGVDRIGNLFCLRASDAEYLLDVIGNSITDADMNKFHTDDLRYAAINLKAMGDYGSIEFRAWRSDGDLKAIEWWCNLLIHLKELARQIDNPAQIVMDVSAMSPRGFFNNILGEFTQDIQWNPEYDHQIVEGVRRVQQYAFLGDW